MFLIKAANESSVNHIKPLWLKTLFWVKLLRVDDNTLNKEEIIIMVD